MDKLVINGGYKLQGDVQISGSKNASLPMLAATLMADSECVLHNVPDLADVRAMIGLLKHLGAKVDRQDNVVVIDPRSVNSVEATYEIVRKMRASVLVLGPLLARYGHARVSLPGGCAIGARPIDLHLRGLEAMGASITLHEGYVEASLHGKRLQGCHIVLDSPSVGATEHLMMTASLAHGLTVIENAAAEPEISALAQMLIAMGAGISGAGTSRICIEGVPALHGVTASVGPDRIEAGTFIAMTAITAGDVLLRGVKIDDLGQVMTKFEHAGCRFSIKAGTSWLSETIDLQVIGPKVLRATDIQTAPFPGFPTDMQAQFMACMTVADGASCIKETIFENRFMHALELMRMGADIAITDRSAVVKGVHALSAAPVMATDLRASASLVIAALRAEGQSEILRIYHLDRGYVALEKKLTALGAHVVRARQELTVAPDSHVS